MIFCIYVYKNTTWNCQIYKSFTDHHDKHEMYPIVFIICIFLVTDGVEYLFTCLLATLISSSMN